MIKTRARRRAETPVRQTGMLMRDIPPPRRILKQLTRNANHSRTHSLQLFVRSFAIPWLFVILRSFAIHPLQRIVIHDLAIPNSTA
ncbi:hypothetical protein [Tropheryma whipplei]|uniref:hypothetical protein n=1 Tax=Tropheryma whipplei TaxID=2039 RepID=UPI001305404A|nr:hypothetical protein [Tropheryma whipplei]